MKIFRLIIISILSLPAFGNVKFDGLVPASKKFSIDFSKSLINNEKQQDDKLNKMKLIAQDFSKIKKNEYTSLVSVLNPIEGLDGYSYFFSFTANDNSGKPLLCRVVVNKSFENYSASCYYILKH